MELQAPNLLSVTPAGNGKVQFNWEPYTLPDGFYGAWGSLQGFDDKGIHQIGAFLYPYQFSAGTATVDCGEKNGVVHCTMSIVAHTTPTQYPTDPNDQQIVASSDVIDISIKHNNK